MRALATLFVLAVATGACAETWPTPDAVLTLKPPAVRAHRKTGILVHIDSPDVLTLETYSTENDWKRACATPCDTAIPVGSRCRVALVDAKYDWRKRIATEEFVLDAPEGTKATLRIGKVAPVEEEKEPFFSNLMVGAQPVGIIFE